MKAELGKFVRSHIESAWENIYRPAGRYILINEWIKQLII